MDKYLKYHNQHKAYSAFNVQQVEMYLQLTVYSSSESINDSSSDMEYSFCPLLFKVFKNLDEIAAKQYVVGIEVANSFTAFYALLSVIRNSYCETLVVGTHTQPLNARKYLSLGATPRLICIYADIVHLLLSVGRH